MTASAPRTRYCSVHRGMGIGRAALCRYKAKAAVRRAYEADCRITNARHGAPVRSDYPLELFQRVITVSLETMKIVRSLPALDIGK